MAHYKLYVPKQTVGASLAYFDCWHAANTGRLLEIISCYPIVSTAVAVNGLVGVDLHLARTTAIGTSGTAAVAEGTNIAVPAISAVDSTSPMNLAVVSARLTPTGGATLGALLSYRCALTEELAAGPIVGPDMARGGYDGTPAILIPPGSGFKVLQGEVASVGTIGFDITLRLT